MADQDEATALRNGASSNGHFSIISGIVYHPDWESVLHRADIALMKMKVPIPEYSGMKQGCVDQSNGLHRPGQRIVRREMFY